MSMYHADDVGRTKQTTQATQLLAKKSQLKSYSVQCSGTGLAKTVKLHKSHPTIPVSLHFDIVNGSSVSGVSTLTNSSGDFNLPFKESGGLVLQLLRMMVFSWRTLFRYKKSDVTKELHAQLEMLENAGIRITGIDSEQHLHAFSPIAESVMDVAAERGLSVRYIGDWFPQTRYGRIKLRLLRLSACFLSSVLHAKPSLPPTWTQKGERYVVASWETTTPSSVPEDYFIECHPGTSFDRGLWERV